MSNYYVIKRDGNTQSVSFDKIQNRLNSLSNNLDVDTTLVSQKVISGIYPGISTQELDVLASEVSVSMSTSHPDYKILAGKIIISNHQKQTKGSFSENMKLLDEATPCVLDTSFYQLVVKHKDFLPNFIGDKDCIGSVTIVTHNWVSYILLIERCFSVGYWNVSNIGIRTSSIRCQSQRCNSSAIIFT